MMLADDTYYGHLEEPVRVVLLCLNDTATVPLLFHFCRKISCFKNEVHEIP